MKSRLNCDSYDGKVLLSFIRGADFAHPGEEEGIKLTCSDLNFIPRAILDVGCGLGGSADWVSLKFPQARVAGIDIDSCGINHAKIRYPHIHFEPCSVQELADVNSSKRQALMHSIADHCPGFDLIYMLTSYYSMPNQIECLRAMASVAAPGASLRIFDFSDPSRNIWPPEEATPGRTSYWNPVEPSTISRYLAAAGWALDNTQDLTQEFKHWYTSLYKSILEKRSQIEAFPQGKQWFEHMQHVYGPELQHEFETGIVGGILVKAHKM